MSEETTGTPETKELSPEEREKRLAEAEENIQKLLGPNVLPKAAEPEAPAPAEPEPPKGEREPEDSSAAAESQAMLDALLTTFRTEQSKIEPFVATSVKSLDRLNLSPEGASLALSYALANILVKHSLPLDLAFTALETFYEQVDRAMVRPGDRVEFVENGAVGEVLKWVESRGWWLIKWDHAPPSPVEPSQIRRL